MVNRFANLLAFTHSAVVRASYAVAKTRVAERHDRSQAFHRGVRDVPRVPLYVADKRTQPADEGDSRLVRLSLQAYNIYHDHVLGQQCLCKRTKA